MGSGNNSGAAISGLCDNCPYLCQLSGSVTVPNLPEPASIKNTEKNLSKNIIQLPVSMAGGLFIFPPQRWPDKATDRPKQASS